MNTESYIISAPFFYSETVNLCIDIQKPQIDSIPDKSYLKKTSLNFALIISYLFILKEFIFHQISWPR
jgi:hypothetical protein